MFGNWKYFGLDFGFDFAVAKRLDVEYLEDGWYLGMVVLRRKRLLRS